MRNTRKITGLLGLLITAGSLSLTAAPPQPGDPMIHSLTGTVGYANLSSYVATSGTGASLSDGIIAPRTDGCLVELQPGISVDAYGRISGFVTVDVDHPVLGWMGCKEVPVRGNLRFDEKRIITITPDMTSTTVQYNNSGQITGSAPLGSSEGEYPESVSLSMSLKSSGQLVDGSPSDASLTNSGDQWSVNFTVSFGGGTEANGEALLTSFDRQIGQFMITRENFVEVGTDSFAGDGIWVSPFGSQLGGSTQLDVYGDQAKAIYDKGGKKLDASILRHRNGDVQAVQLGYMEAPSKRIISETEDDPFELPTVAMEEIVQTPNARTWTVYSYPVGVPR